MFRGRQDRAASAPRRRAWLPPRWFIVAFWYGHRAVLRSTDGRIGLWRPKAGKWGALRLTTTGRRSGMSRQVVVGYVEDGLNLVTLAMNGWGPAEPAWWLNLQEHPDAVVQTRDGTQQVRGRRAEGEEHDRLRCR
jgi:deazaflavin-dependent oxidoreductase (nitroreductase family)